MNLLTHTSRLAHALLSSPRNSPIYTGCGSAVKGIIVGGGKDNFCGHAYVLGIDDGCGWFDLCYKKMKVIVKAQRSCQYIFFIVHWHYVRKSMPEIFIQ